MTDKHIDALREFVEETRDHLTSIEPDLLRLEEQQSKAEPEVVNRVFRAIHSAKGGASFLGIEALTRLSHAMEHILARLRDRTLEANSEVIGALLRGVDVLRAMLDDIEHCEEVPSRSVLEELQRLHADGGQSEVAAESSTPLTKLSLRSLSDLGVSPEVVAQCLAQGMLLYVIELGPELATRGVDVATVAAKVEAIGRVLGSRQQAEGAVLFCATVLDKQMLSTELGLDGAQLLSLDGQLLKRELKHSQKQNGTRANEHQAADRSTADDLVMNASLRVRLRVLNRLMNVGGELVLARNQLLRTLEDRAEHIPGLPAILQSVDRLTSDLQESIMQTRMQPVALLFSRYPRVVRDLSRQLGKQVTLRTSGTSVELDRTIVEALVDPLTHVIRNCISHGIEAPAERRLRGKPSHGIVTLAAYHRSGHVTIEVTDDGRGIDLPRLVQRALDEGVLRGRDPEQLSERELLELAMEPGLSTAEEVSDISGRGVGLDVVRSNIGALGGDVELSTKLGGGTTVRLRLPLTLAIIPALIVGAADARFVLPQSSILELVWVQAAQVAHRIEQIDGIPVLRLRGQLLPLVRLADVMEMRRSYVDPDTGAQRFDRRQSIVDRRTDEPSLAALEPPSRRQNWTSDYSVVVLQSGADRFGLIVDELFDSEEIVIKPLPTYFKGIECFAGTAILGDGRVTMILDPGGVASRAKLSFQKLVREDPAKSGEPLAPEPRHKQRSVILVDASPGEHLAVPQESVLRVERIFPGDINQMGDREYIQYHAGGLPLVRLEDHFPVSAAPRDAGELFVILPKTADRSAADVRAGILVWRVADAIDVDVEMQPPLFDGPGVVGSGIVEGRLTSFFDPVSLAVSATESRRSLQ